MTFNMAPAGSIETGEQVQNFASITFGMNDPIVTDPWNTIDRLAPTSQVLPLAVTQTTPSFTVQWDGSDADSGVRNYDIYVSEDDGSTYTQWLNDATGNSAAFSYGKHGKTYRFYSIATDHVGNREAVPQTSDSVTTVMLEEICLVPGDLDGDCDVDMEDRAILLGAFRSCNGSAKYIEAADYDGDGCISFSDYRIWYGHFRSYQSLK